MLKALVGRACGPLRPEVWICGSKTVNIMILFLLSWQERGGRHVACLVVSSMRIVKKSKIGYIAQRQFTYIINKSVEQ